jgi:hypothetical protein
VVPGLLLLVARDLALHDPPRVLAWRLAHDPRLAAAGAWLGPLLPAPSGALDRDPVALLLAALAVVLALAYATLVAFGARPAARAVAIAVAASLLIVLPSVAFVAMGAAADRPYGQDGGVVQLPFAIDRILAGHSPYGADYSGTILAREARVSSFWDELGGNPILHHHAYLPGTHLVMLPFQLASRATLGFFDPRVVTLLFYALVAVLAARVPQGAAARLSAAGVAALNPLGYWQQIFGANDVVFVAMLLGAVLLARRGRGPLAGALLGLACATKQLAWPFAPFLVVYLSGARTWRELVASASWRRAAGPLAAAVSVFVAVVLPVAALDFRAFWGDVVVYNVGLPGGDNYPLGGTPGLGFANFLIYFGRVASLRDYFPFSVFYVLLVPLGLLLLRSQLREGRAEWALATGTGALVASLYFSRVVHPNYLVPAALLLPVAVLARSRRGAALALAPLLLLAVAVETALNALFRTTWEQAAGAGLPARLGGLAAALAPRAGPALTRDPLGLLFSATAAGLALACLSADLAGAGARLRAVLRVAAAALVVVGPALVLVSVSERTGLVRAQDPAVVQAAADAGRLARLRSPYTPPPETTPRGREAVSSSFRLDPPAEQEPERPLLPPGPSLLALAGRLIGERDLRVVGLLCLGLIGCAIAASLRGESRQAALAVALLSPPAALGTALGSPVVLSLAALVAAWAAARRGRGGLSGMLAGVAVAMDHRSLLAALPLLAISPALSRSRWRTGLAGAATYAAIVLPVALLDPAAFLARWGEAAGIGPGLGLFNLVAYRGAEASSAAPVIAAVCPALAVLLAAALALRPPLAPPAAVAALAALVGIALAPSSSAEVVLVPIVLLTLAAAEGAVPAPGMVASALQAERTGPRPSEGS